MVSNGILEHRNQILVLNNKKIGSSYEVILDRKKHDKKRYQMENKDSVCYQFSGLAPSMHIMVY